MAQKTTRLTGAPELVQPAIRKISVADLRDALDKGFEDFNAKPSHVVFLSLIYPILGLLMGRLMFGYDIFPLLFPLAAGFSLVGPLAAVGLYELSRRRELGLESSWRNAFDVIHSPSIGAITILGIVLMVIFFAWLASAQAVYEYAFGDTRHASLTEFLRHVFTTREGWLLILLGNAVGFLYALTVLAISIVSFPLLIDRKVGVVAAVLTSIRAVLANPREMAIWGLIVACSLVAGSIPLFFGLAIVVPVLGHSTWHLYRKVVGR